MAKPTSNKVEKSEYTGHGVKTSQPDNDTKNKIVERFTDARRYALDDCKGFGYESISNALIISP